MKSRYRNIAMAVAAAWFGVAMTSVQARETAQLPDRAAGVPSAQTAANLAGQHEGTAAQDVAGASAAPSIWCAAEAPATSCAAVPSCCPAS